MRIVIDMQGAQTESRYRGIGRYTLALAQAIVRNGTNHEIFLALNGLLPESIEPIRAAFDDLLPQEHIRVWHAPGPVRERESGNESRRDVAELIRESFLASLRPDVIHISSLFEGYGDDAVTSIGRFDQQTPVSVTLHDLIPLLNPDHYLKPEPHFATYYQKKVAFLKRADVFLAVSESSRKEGITYAGITENKIFNTQEAVESRFQRLIIDENTALHLRKQFNIISPFALYTGGADERKNLPRLIEAWAALPATLRTSHQLVFAGKMSEACIARFKQQAKSIGLSAAELCFTGYVNDEELVQLYNLCRVYVFPSWHEGFGLPALEAMACGATVIGANTSSLPEVIGLEEALFDPFDVKAISAKIAQALEDESFQNRLRAHGLQQAQKFSWDETAKRAIAAWKRLQISKPGRQRMISASDKPRLAFVSPLPPERTGIADYSAELLPALAEHYQLTVITDQDCVIDPWITANCTIRAVDWLKNNTHTVDRILYHVGNSPFHQHMLPLLQEVPGTVVLHDFYLSGLMSWLEVQTGTPVWAEALYAAHGYKAVHEYLLDPEAAKQKYPCNLSVLQNAKGIITHSGYAKTLATTWYDRYDNENWQVIPLLRSPAKLGQKAAARRILGIPAEDFIICSFGFLDQTKLNHRLLDCWLASALPGNKACQLIFVGENHGGAYGANLLDKIRSNAASSVVHITGYVSLETFGLYLASADMAVQLRTSSRGETSAAVLDCMNHALPTIVNANGSMAELPSDAAWILPDTFDDSELINALETLWYNQKKREVLGNNARKTILKEHSPADCARRYVAALEQFYQSQACLSHEVIQAIAALPSFTPLDEECRQLACSLATSFPLLQPAKRLLVDVSATCRNDLKTGIERVARALLVALLETPPKGYRVEPVYLDNHDGTWQYRRACRYTLALLGTPSENLSDEIVAPENGDVLLGVDLSGERLVKAAQSGFFEAWRNQGVEIYSVVFDLLPIRMPEVFPANADRLHRQWLEVVSTFDGAICISKAVADDLVAWQAEVEYSWQHRRPYHVNWFHLGADVLNSAPITGLPRNAEFILEEIRKRPTFLMVGTIEPRKGYLQILHAFNKLWSADIEANLVIVGKEGWQGLPEDMRRDIPETIRALRTHPKLNQHLFWLEGVSDEYLEKIYSAATCLIAASYGEGFGLPLIEAAQHKLPIIARDINVFREVAGSHAYYFPNDKSPAVAADAIIAWLALYAKNEIPLSGNMAFLTWKKSAAQLIQACLAQRNDN